MSYYDEVDFALDSLKPTKERIDEVVNSDNYELDVVEEYNIAYFMVDGYKICVSWNEDYGIYDNYSVVADLCNTK